MRVYASDHPLLTVKLVREEHDGYWWALGPPKLSPVGAPARVRAGNIHGGLELYLMVYWDAWIEDAECSAWVDLGIERVRARGRGWDYYQPA